MSREIREVTDRRCPRCGSTLITDGRRIWCTFFGTEAGRVPEPACAYGLDAPVPADPPKITSPGSLPLQSE